MNIVSAKVLRFPAWAFSLVVILGCCFLLAMTMQSCSDSTAEGLSENAQDTVVTDTSKVSEEAGESPPPIDTALLNKLKACDGFDFPVGPPDAVRYYKARGLLPVGLEHLGEDWNGNRGGNTDFGDYVYAAADGVVFYSDHYNNGWGTVIRMLHNYGTESAPKYVETLYAHVSNSWVKVGYVMKRGEVIGMIGSAEGKYHAHLHLEMRKKPGKDIRCGYDGDTLGFTDPTAFIEAHRPKQR